MIDDMTHYREETDYSKYLKLFDLVQVEPFSFCNRTCWFCPNSFIDRRSTNNLMPEETYLKLLNELSEHDYSSRIDFGRYNEPFADDIIFKRIEQAAEIVPKSMPHTNTNGDYLNHEKIIEAEKSGLRTMFIQLYPSKEYSKEETLRVYEKTQKRCKLDMKMTIDELDWTQWDGSVGKMTILMYGRDFKTNGYDRGGTIESLKGKRRTDPCYAPLHSIYIDWNGSVMPCCHLRSDRKEHEEYIIGNINDSSLIDCLFNDHACSFRKEMITTELKKGACATCNFRTEEDLKTVKKWAIMRSPTFHLSGN